MRKCLRDNVRMDGLLWLTVLEGSTHRCGQGMMDFRAAETPNFSVGQELGDLV